VENETENVEQVEKLSEAEILARMEQVEAAKTPAARVIAAFKTQAKAAKAIDVSRAAICLWNKPEPRHGEQAGRIPSRQFGTILAAAGKLGIPLTADHLARFDD